MRDFEQILVMVYASVLHLIDCLIAVPTHPNTLSQELEKLLVRDSEWTPSAAEHLLRLANDYGAFMLRNALALSLVLGIEDGELGF